MAVVQIGNILDSYAATLTKRGDHDVFYITTQGISQLVQRSVTYLLTYSASLNGYFLHIIHELTIKLTLAWGG